jgi:hypothetical protein
MTDPQLDAKVPVLILLNKQVAPLHFVLAPSSPTYSPVPWCVRAAAVTQDVADPKVVERMKESMGALAATSSRPSALFPICALNGYDAIHEHSATRKELTAARVITGMEWSRA